MNVTNFSDLIYNGLGKIRSSIEGLIMSNQTSDDYFIVKERMRTNTSNPLIGYVNSISKLIPNLVVQLKVFLICFSIEELKCMLIDSHI
jgi:hypothetical protein